MEINVFAVGSFFIAIIGLFSGITMYRAKVKLSNPDLISLINWLSISVLFCGVPYAIWVFLIDSKILMVVNEIWARVPGMILVGLFFIFMLKSSLIIHKIGNKYGFKEKLAKIMSKKIKKN